MEHVEMLQCTKENELVACFSFLRIGVIVVITTYNTCKLMTGTSVKAFLSATLVFLCTDGVHMSAYFMTSCFLDNFTAFCAPELGMYCAPARLVALYTSSLLTYLPNLFFAKFMGRAMSV